VLVLSRRLRQKIVLPGLNLTVQVLEIKGGTVRLGIEGPPEVPVLREELRGQRPTAVGEPPSPPQRP